MKETLLLLEEIKLVQVRRSIVFVLLFGSSVCVGIFAALCVIYHAGRILRRTKRTNNRLRQND